MQIIVTIFTHDYYVMQLPVTSTNEQFYKDLSYLNLSRTNYKGRPATLNPIIRLYGTTNLGEKCCLHVHGFYPYLYIKAEEFSLSFKEDVFLRQFLDLVEGLFKQAYRCPKQDIIHRAELEEKYDFYGYHSQKEVFLKIYLYDAAHIPKLRELFSSKMVSNKSFQCYEAHINHYMHFFADLNIYGLHEVTLLNFKFRKNIDGLQQHFRKLSSYYPSSPKVQQIGGLSLTDLSRDSPGLFSPLQKLSSCYLQVDVHYTSIINYLYNLISNTDTSRYSFDSQLAMYNIQDQKDQYFHIKITKALEQFWYDEKERRSAMGIKRDVVVKVDYAKNIEQEEEVRDGKKDPLWMNFVNKGQTFNKIKTMVESYKKATALPQRTDLFGDKELLQGYDDFLLRMKDKEIINVENRIKFYGVRSRRIIQEVTLGKRAQLPDWDEKSLSEHSSSGGQDSGEQNNTQKSQVGSEKSKNVLNFLMETRSTASSTMAQFRNNYKIQKGQVKHNGFFCFCSFCKNIMSRCVCKRNVFDLPQNIKNFFELKTTNKQITLRYNARPPSVADCLASIKAEHQFPFYSNIEDYFKHHNIPSQFPRTKRNAQILCKEVKVPKIFTNIVGIKNEDKLPEFWRDMVPYENMSQPEARYCRLKYNVKPPKVPFPLPQQHLIEREPKPKPIPSTLTTAADTQMSQKSNKAGVFSCDLSKMTFQLICECSSPAASNPQCDQVIGILYSVSNEMSEGEMIGLVALSKFFKQMDMSKADKIHDIMFVKDEKDVLMMFALLVFKFDPDLLISYDQEKKGIYYLVNRGAAHSLNYCELLSRSLNQLDYLYDVAVFRDFQVVKSTFLTYDILVRHRIESNKQTKTTGQDTLKKIMQKIEERKARKPMFRKKYIFNIIVRGRVVLNLFRVYEFELKLKSYTIEAVVKHLFNEQIYEFTDRSLFETLIKTPDPIIEYYFIRIRMTSRIITRLNVLTAVIEKSKLYGCNFTSMLQRGSQFKIESIMYRVSRTNDYLLLSASRSQVAQQKVLQCWPLVLEPPKQYFTDPVLVFDFQSLYPSMMISFNLCYSTCLGSLKQLFNPNTRKKRLGVMKAANVDLSVIEEVFDRFPQQQWLDKLQRYIFVTPNDVAFVRKNIREGIIPRILLEFLMSRIMIKDSSKVYSSEAIKRLLNERQIAIKLFMNVMYGYTGASFSGRMPCSEIADSVVEMGRYLLTTCIKDMDDNPRYGKGKVVYGDTDSIFYHLPSYSLEDAFKIGDLIAKDMTKKFSYPVQLKFEKAYDNLILVAKKRYYGRCFQKPNSQPKYEGKGLECVRRDGIDFTCEFMRQTLNKIFDNKDLSVLKHFVLTKLSQAKAGFYTEENFAFSKQVKLLKYNESTMPAHGVAARQLEAYDPNMVPKYGQRMKYLVVKGQQQKVRNNVIPLFLYKGQPLNYDYYVSRLIVPPIQRTLTSIANISDWMVQLPILFNPLNKHTFSAKRCVVCQKVNQAGLCYQCKDNILPKIQNLQGNCEDAELTCVMCVGNKWVDKPLGTQIIEKCVEWNCKNLFRRKRKAKARDLLVPELLMYRAAVAQFQK